MARCQLRHRGKNYMRSGSRSNNQGLEKLGPEVSEREGHPPSYLYYLTQETCVLELVCM